MKVLIPATSERFGIAQNPELLIALSRCCNEVMFVAAESGSYRCAECNALFPLIDGVGHPHPKGRTREQLEKMWIRPEIELTFIKDEGSVEWWVAKWLGIDNPQLVKVEVS